MNYGISRYPYHHGIFKTDEYYEVYRHEDGEGAGIGTALFGSKEDAEEYMEWKQNKETDNGG